MSDLARGLFVAGLMFVIYVLGTGWYCADHNEKIYAKRSYRSGCYGVFLHFDSTAKKKFSEQDLDKFYQYCNKQAGKFVDQEMYR